MAIKFKQARESWKLDCQECGAEFSIIIEYKPSSRDFMPHCPYCDARIDLDVADSVTKPKK